MCINKNFNRDIIDRDAPEDDVDFFLDEMDESDYADDDDDADDFNIPGYELIPHQFGTYFANFETNITYLSDYEFCRLYDRCQDHEPEAIRLLRLVAEAPLDFEYFLMTVVFESELLILLDAEHLRRYTVE